MNNPPTYTSLIDDSFGRADTAVAAGSKSTAGVGNGWLDLAGSTYCLQAAEGGLIRNRPAPKTPTGVRSALYQAGSAALTSGRVNLYVGTASDYNRGAVFRVSSVRGNANGYYVGVNRDGVFFIARVLNNIQTELVNEPARGVLFPAGFVIQATCLQLDALRTQLSVAVCNPSNLSLPLTSRTIIDSERNPLQNAAGIMGVSSQNQGFDASRVTLFSVA